jgi:hypothetical protein
MCHKESKHVNSAQISYDNIKTEGFSYRSHNKYYDYPLKTSVHNLKIR